jgi:hypothetical protein
MTKKISDLVHAGKYTDAQKLTAAMLILYPDDQRLIKAKVLIDQLLATTPAATIPAATVPPVAAPQIAPASRESDTPTTELIVPPDSFDHSETADATQAGPAILHIYRLRHIVGSAGLFGIYLDGAKVTSVHNGEAIRMLIPPGKHSISVSSGGIKTGHPINDLEMEAGHVYWVRADLGPWAPSISVIPAAEGESESRQLQQETGDPQPRK